MVTVFFDIDGTLIDAGGAGGHAMVTTLWEEFGVEVDTGRVSFAGRTDRFLVNELLGHHGIESSAEIFERFRQPFLEKLRDTLPRRDGRVLPGVIHVLEQLSASDQVRLGLITGNLRQASRIKLDHFELSGYFYHDGDPVGGFGDDHAERDDVARGAMAELTELLGGPPQSDVWVVGDTKRDISCARAIGARVLAVGTGSFSRDELAQHEPDLLCTDLTDAVNWVQSLVRNV